jgi:hypothetical protein
MIRCDVLRTSVSGLGALAFVSVNSAPAATFPNHAPKTKRVLFELDLLDYKPLPKDRSDCESNAGLASVTAVGSQPRRGDHEMIRCDVLRTSVSGLGALAFVSVPNHAPKTKRVLFELDLLDFKPLPKDRSDCESSAGLASVTAVGSQPRRGDHEMIRRDLLLNPVSGLGALGFGPLNTLRLANSDEVTTK